VDLPKTAVNIAIRSRSMHVYCIIWFLLICSSILFFSRCNPPSQQKGASQGPGSYQLAESCRQRGSYDSAIVYYNSAIEESFRTSSWQEWGRGINGMIDSYRAKGEVDSALHELDRWDSLTKGKIRINSNEYAGLLHKRAVLYTDLRRYAESIELLKKSISIRNKLGLSRDTATALAYNGLGNNYLYLEKYEDALQYYSRAIHNYDSLGMKSSPDYAMFNQNAGIICAIKGDYGKAQEYFELALSINKEILDRNDPKLALVYLNLGRFFSLTGNDEKALELLTQSENIFKSTDPKSPKLVPLYVNIGSIFVVKANYEKALSYYNKALALLQSANAGNQSDLLTVMLNLGFINEKKGDFERAKKYYLEGINQGDKYQNSVKVLRGLANISYIQGRKQEAIQYYEHALRNSVEMFGQQHPETALTYFKYGDFCSVSGDKARALEYYTRGLEIYRKAYGEKNRDVGNAYLYIANFFERNKEYGRSLDYFQKALVAGFSNFNSLDVSQNPVPDKNKLSYIQLNMVSGKASVLQYLYRQQPSRIDYLKASAAAYALALNMIEMLRSTYQEDDSKLLIAGNEKNTLVNAIRTQVELYKRDGNPDDLEKAFAISEKGKSSVLLSYLRDLEAKDLGKIPDNLRKLDNSLKSEIAFYNKLLYEESIRSSANQSKINRWNTTLFELSRKHDSLIRVIETNYPAYYNLKYDNSVISLQKTSKSLNDRQALVEYTLSDSILYIFAVTKKEHKLYIEPIDQSFYNDLKTIREMLTGKSFNNYSPADLHAFTHSSYDLFRTLLEPAWPMIKGKELIVVPDADLGYLSFDILLTRPADPKAKGYRGLPYLIKESMISYTPSATALFEGLKKTEKHTNHEVLAFAPSYENIKGVRADNLLEGVAQRDYLLPIPGAQIEVKNLRSIFRSKVFDGSKATEQKFKKKAGDYSILHLAMHTIINNNNPMYSKLVFFHNQDTIEDGLLNTSELFGMQLNADLAVLSACNTGTGKLEQGEGIMSLSRGFFYAGVPSIIMTAWAVEDLSGSELMTSFYKYLSEGKPKNEALRLAKIDYLENSDQLKAHPHYWAAYMNIGDISPIRHLRKPIPSFCYYLSSGLAILAIAFLILFRIRKQRRLS